MYNISLNDIDTVVFDFDDVLVHSLRSATKVLFDKYYRYSMKEMPNYKDVKKWNLEDIFPNITKEIVEDVFASQEFFDNLEINEGMYKAIRFLKKQGKHIVVLSLGTSLNISQKSKFLLENFRGMYDYFVYAGSDNSDLKMDKSIFHFGNRSVLIDDHENNLYSFSGDYKILAKLIDDTPRECNSTWNGLTVHSGEELINIFR